MSDFIDVEYIPLLKATRQIRIEALPLIDDLLDCIKLKAKSVISSIDEAEESAQDL